MQSLCSGEFLEGFGFDDCEPMADWCYAMRELIGQRRGRLLARRVAAYRMRGDSETALALLTRWQCLDRFNEDVHQQLIELHLQRNERWQAEKVFGDYKRKLYEELGVGPSSTLAELLAGMGQGVTPTAPGDSDPAVPETHYLKSGSVFMDPPPNGPVVRITFQL